MGATFAYFSIVQSGNGSTQTNVNGQVQDITGIGVAFLDQGENELYLALTAADMGFDNVGTKYWAKKSTEATAEKTANTESVTVSSSHPETGATTHLYTISTAKLTGGPVGQKYECTSTLTATLTGTDAESIKTALGTNNSPVDEPTTRPSDGKFVFKQADGATDTNKIVFADGKSEFTLKEIADGSAKVNVTYQITAKGEKQDSSVPLEAGLLIENTAGKQNDLAGKKIEIQITNEPFHCSVVEEFTGE